MSASKQPVIKVPKHTDMLKYNISVVLQLHLQALKYNMSSQIWARDTKRVSGPTEDATLKKNLWYFSLSLSCVSKGISWLILFHWLALFCMFWFGLAVVFVWVFCLFLLSFFHWKMQLPIHGAFCSSHNIKCSLGTAHVGVLCWRFVSGVS